MATSATDLATAEGVRKVVAEIVREDVLYMGGGPSQSKEIYIKCDLSAYEKITVSGVWVRDNRRTPEDFELSGPSWSLAIGHASSGYPNTKNIAIEDLGDGAAVVKLSDSGATNTNFNIYQIVGIRSGGGVSPS